MESIVTTKQVYLVCGYRRTGKDTLVKMFNKELEFNWLVYSDTSYKLECENVIRVGFADKLREEVNQILNLSDNFDYDTFKETIVQNGQTYRDILIQHGGLRRSQDIDYWVKQIIPRIQNTKENIMITDWRFRNELICLERNLEELNQNKYTVLKTIRVFRSEVPIPPYEVDSEHNLDKTLTDFLLVTSEEEFTKACELFPQYINFVKQ